jgi:hypothetical protein
MRFPNYFKVIFLTIFPDGQSGDSSEEFYNSNCTPKRSSPVMCRLTYGSTGRLVMELRW